MKEYIPLFVIYFSLVSLGTGLQTIFYFTNLKLNEKVKLKEKTQSLICTFMVFSLVWPTFRVNGISFNDTLACLIILLTTAMFFDRALSTIFIKQEEDIIRENEEDILGACN